MILIHFSQGRALSILTILFYFRISSHARGASPHYPCRSAIYPGIFQVVLYAGLFIFAQYLVSWLHLPLPANLVGMILMLALIVCRILPLQWVRAGARWLLAEMLLFFVPAVVAVVNYAQLLLVDGWRILL